MTHYHTDYSTIQDRKAKDEQAIKDIREYLSQAQWDAFMIMVGELKADQSRTPTKKIQSLNFAMGMFAGITGFPFHAFCRKYLLAEYREFMADHDIDGIVLETDAEGFPIHEKG